MTMTVTPASGTSRQALVAACVTYVMWGLIPLVFQVAGHLGAGAWEILVHRVVWGLPAALVMVLMARQGRELLAALRKPRTMALLVLSATLISLNWIGFIWSVNNGHVLETSLGYYILPLLNMAAGAILFRERLGRLELVAVALAAVGVALQTVALGHLPAMSLFLAFSFLSYGIVRKRVAVDGQTGLAIECLILIVFALPYALWLEATGAGHFFADPRLAVLLVICGPLTALPLALFAWAARRLPLSMMGFLQFIAPCITFVIGIAQGEAFSPLRGVSFVFIWGGAAVFAYGAWRASRQLQRAA
jgi:chloramphenicol-sensitive protein RarD